MKNTMLYNHRADRGCTYWCCCEIGKSGGLTNRKHRQAGQQLLRTREKRAWRAEVWA